MIMTVMMTNDDDDNDGDDDVHDNASDEADDDDDNDDADDDADVADDNDDDDDDHSIADDEDDDDDDYNNDDDGVDDHDDNDDDAENDDDDDDDLLKNCSRTKKLRSVVISHGDVKIGEYQNSNLCSSSIPDCFPVVSLLSLKYQRWRRVKHPFPACYNSLSPSTVPSLRGTREAARNGSASIG